MSLTHELDVAEMPDAATSAVVESMLIDVLSPDAKAKLVNARREKWRFTSLGTPPERFVIRMSVD